MVLEMRRMMELLECLLGSSNQPVLLPQQELEIFQRLLEISVMLEITFSENKTKSLKSRENKRC